MFRVASALCAAVMLTACGSKSPPTAPDATPAAPNATLPAGPGASGRFVRTGYAVTGTATLAVENGVGRLTFSSDFSIGQTPGPFVYLNTTNNPNSGQPLRVAGLKNKSGAQEYVFSVPAGVKYGYVLIWCDPFNVAMAEAKIPTT